MRKPDGRRLYIQEMAARDGLQIEKVFVPTADKIALIDRLGRVGFAEIEVSSFTSPKAIPTLADAEAVFRGITRVPGVTYSALVPNLRGCERALAAGVDKINVVLSASESHNRANLRMGRAQSLTQIAAVAALARRGDVFVNASVSTAFGCPFEGEIAADVVFDIAWRLLDMGIDGLSFCDTTGVANPVQVEALFERAVALFPSVMLTAHFHDTRGLGLANALAALEAGVIHFDSALGGLGGCPFAPGASGNVCTEDLVHMFGAMGYDTGIDLTALLDIARDVPALVGHGVPGQLIKAGPSTRRYLPDVSCIAAEEPQRRSTS